MQHPHIVQIYEVGQHAGCPYMTMEFLEGGSLEDLLDGRAQPPRMAAELVETLARAMHGAHLRGIIHRDLKPANVLFAGTGVAAPSQISTKWQAGLVPKITDFGLAKRLEQSEGQTAPGIVMGTPSYMAPEQAEGRSRDVGPAADVYALGAILYEMLTGQPPFRGDTQLETIRKVVSEEPVAPRSLQPRVPHDLTTICLKCLAKQPARRYPSAGALADDLRRFLSGEPILARRANTAERVGKWIKRHPAGTALIGVIVAAGMVLMGDLWVSYQRIRHERDTAQKAYEIAYDAVDHLYTKMVEERLIDEPGKDPLREELFKRSQEVYERFIDQHGEDRKLVRQCALAWFRIAEIHRIVEQLDAASEEYGKAIERQESLCRDEPNNPDYLRDLASSQNWLGEMLRENHQRLREAEPHFREALRLQSDAQALLRDELLKLRACQVELARSHYNLGIVEMDTGRPVEALADYDAAVDLLSRLLIDKPDDDYCIEDLAQARTNRGILHKENGRYDKARADYTWAAENLAELQKRAVRRVVHRYDLAIVYQNLGYLEGSQGYHDRSLMMLREAQAILETLVADFSTRPRYQKKLANTYNLQGIALAGTLDRPGAAASWNKARTILTPLVTKVPDPTDYEALLGQVVGNLGWLKTQENAWTEARALLEEALPHLRAGLAPQVERQDYQRALATNLRNLSETLVQLKDHAAAVNAAEYLATSKPILAIHHYYAACFIARSIPFVRDDPTLGNESARRGKEQEYAARAVVHLRAAAANPDRTLKRLADESQYFAVLSGQAGFSDAMRDLNAKTSKP
jgi:tetratricopeptide (TPR) repeat protein